MCNYFLKLSPKRTQDGKKDFTRIPHGPEKGLRMIYTKEDALKELQVAVNAGNIQAQVVATERPVTVLPSISDELTYQVDSGVFRCDQYPALIFKAIPEGYDILFNGSWLAKTADFEKAKEQVELFKKAGVLDE